MSEPATNTGHPFTVTGQFQFLCAGGHRIEQSGPDLDACPVPRCGADVEYRLIPYMAFSTTKSVPYAGEKP